MDELLAAAAHSIEYLARLKDRRVFPDPDALVRLERLAGPLPDGPTPPEETIDLLHRFGSPATVATAGPRYFGFVTGGVLWAGSTVWKGITAMRISVSNWSTTEADVDLSLATV